MSIISQALSDLAQLKKPVTAAAVVALITQLIPGLHVNSVTISGVFIGVGVVATFVEAQWKLAEPTAPVGQIQESTKEPVLVEPPVLVPVDTTANLTTPDPTELP